MDVNYLDDDPKNEVLFSQKVSSSDFARWQKADVKKSVGEDAKTLLLVIYWDATTTDIRGKFSMHPVYCSVAQIDPTTNRKWMCKRHVGFLPKPVLNTMVVGDHVSANAQSDEVTIFGRQLYQLALRYMLEPLAYWQHGGFEFNAGEAEIFRLVPRLFHFVGDIPEG